MPFLDRGYSVSNVVFLKKALEATEVDIKGFDAQKSVLPAEDKIPKQLTNKLNRLYATRCQLSNQYHILATTKERAANCKKILNVQEQMAGIWKQIDFFKATGKLITKVEDDYGLPNDPLALSSKIRSLRSTISRNKKQINALQNGTDEKSKTKLKHLVNKNKQDIIKLTLAELKIEKL